MFRHTNFFNFENGQDLKQSQLLTKVKLSMEIASAIKASLDRAIASG